MYAGILSPAYDSGDGASAFVVVMIAHELLNFFCRSLLRSSNQSHAHLSHFRLL